MRNDRLSALGLMHIHRDFAVNLDKAMDVFVAAKNGGQIRVLSILYRKV
jgi:hypothetical protein